MCMRPNLSTVFKCPYSSVVGAFFGYCETLRSPRPSVAPSCLGLCLSSFQNTGWDGRVIMTSAAQLHPVCPSITHTIKYKIFQNNNCMSCSPTTSGTGWPWNMRGGVEVETGNSRTDVTGHTAHSSRRIFPERNSNFSPNQDFSTDTHILVKIRINHR